MNRDYWRKPIQSYRTSHGYGHTQLSHDQMSVSAWWLIGALIAVLIVCNL